MTTKTASILTDDISTSYLAEELFAVDESAVRQTLARAVLAHRDEIVPRALSADDAAVVAYEVYELLGEKLRGEFGDGWDFFLDDEFRYAVTSALEPILRDEDDSFASLLDAYESAKESRADFIAKLPAGIAPEDAERLTAAYDAALEEQLRAWRTALIS